MDFVTITTTAGAAIGLASLIVAILQLKKAGSAAKAPSTSSLPADAVSAGFEKAPDTIYSDLDDIPPRIPFLGREAELAKLDNWISGGGRKGLIMLSGPGGIGKSSLAARLLYRILEEQPAGYDVTVWRSLKEGLPAAHAVCELLSMLSRGTTVIFGGYAANLSALQRLLRKTRLLLVLDNLESVLDESGQFKRGFREYESLMAVFSSGGHESTLVITGRELPASIATMSTGERSVASMRLGGLDLASCGQIITSQQVTPLYQHVKELSTRLAGNPLTIKLAASIARDVFDGDLSAYLAATSLSSGDVSALIGEQIARASELETEILYWLAIERIPVRAGTVIHDLVETDSKPHAAVALNSLYRKNLCERTNNALFSLQPAVADYVMSRLCESVSQEVVSGAPVLLNSIALLTPTSADFVQQAQRRLLIEPLVTRLKDGLGLVRLGSSLHSLRELAVAEFQGRPGYLAGNIINLAGAVGLELRNSSFSGLSIWNADLRFFGMQGSDFRRANFRDCLFYQRISAIHALCESSDGKLVAAGGSTGEIWILKLNGLQEHALCRGHSDWVRALAWHPTEPILASAGDDGSVRIWNSDTGVEIARCDGHDGKVTVVAFDVRAGRLLSGGEDGHITLWSTSTWKLERRIRVSSRSVWALATSEMDRILAAAGEDSVITLWDLDSWTRLGSLSGHEGWVLALAFEPEGAELASGGHDGVLRHWDVGARRLLSAHKGHGESIFSVSWQRGAGAVAAAYGDGVIQIWRVRDTNSSREQQALIGHTHRVWAVRFLPNRDVLVSGGEDQSLRLWEVSSTNCERVVTGYTSQTYSFDIMRETAHQTDGLLWPSIVTGGEDGRVRVWSADGNSYMAVHATEEHHGRIWSVRSKSRHEVLSAGEDGKIIRWTAGPAGWSSELLGTLNRQIWSLEMLPEKQLVAVASETPEILLVDSDSGFVVGELIGHEASVWSMVAVHDSTRLASASYDGTVGWWDVDSKRLLSRIRGHRGAVTGVAYDQRRNWLFSGGHDGRVCWWDEDRLRVIRAVPAHSGPIWSLDVCSAGTLLASGSGDRSIVVLEIETGEIIARLDGHLDWVQRVAFLDERRLVSCSSDGTTRLWDFGQHECLQVIQVERPYDGIDMRMVSGLDSNDLTALAGLGVRTDDGVADG